jgi:hypothetical protein
MMNFPGQLRLQQAGLAVLLQGLLCCTVAAQDPTLEELQAGFIFNFMKYTQWPDAQQTGTLLICNPDAPSRAANLDILNERVIDSRVIKLLAPAPLDTLEACDVLLINAVTNKDIKNILRIVGRSSVLTISDAPDFALEGGMIQLEVQGGKIRFHINQGAAKNAGLELSSQVLRLAETVIE